MAFSKLCLFFVVSGLQASIIGASQGNVEGRWDGDPVQCRLGSYNMEWKRELSLFCGCAPLPGVSTISLRSHHHIYHICASTALLFPETFTIGSCSWTTSQFRPWQTVVLVTILLSLSQDKVYRRKILVFRDDKKCNVSHASRNNQIHTLCYSVNLHNNNNWLFVVWKIRCCCC